MLKLYAENGEIAMKDFLFDLSSVGDLDQKLGNLDQHFVEEFSYITISFAIENLPIFVYVAGFVALKVMSKLNCCNCKKILSPGRNIINAEINSLLNEYFYNFNRQPNLSIFNFTLYLLSFIQHFQHLYFKQLRIF